MVVNWTVRARDSIDLSYADRVRRSHNLCDRALLGGLRPLYNPYTVGLSVCFDSAAACFTEVFMRHWVRNVYQAVVTVAALWVACGIGCAPTIPGRGRSPSSTSIRSSAAKIYPRFRGFHRYDLTTCIACERCARDCPVGCILHWQGACGGAEGIPDHQLHDRLRQVHVLCDLHRELSGGLHFHGLVVRFELLQPGGQRRRFLAAAGGGGVGACDAQSDGGGELESHYPAGSRRPRFVMRDAVVVGERLAKAPAATPRICRLWWHAGSCSPMAFKLCVPER